MRVISFEQAIRNCLGGFYVFIPVKPVSGQLPPYRRACATSVTISTARRSDAAKLVHTPRVRQILLTALRLIILKVTLKTGPFRRYRLAKKKRI